MEPHELYPDFYSNEDDPDDPERLTIIDYFGTASMGEVIKFADDRALTCKTCTGQEWNIFLDQGNEVKLFVCVGCGAEIEFTEDVDNTGIFFEIP
jgi:hypothetical protein